MSLNSNLAKMALLGSAILFCNSSHAQSLSIASFSEYTSDLSARTYSRQDLNNTDCALVKVRLAQFGATFNGIVIGEVEYKTSEYWVYMADGSKKLTVMVPNFLPLDITFADYNIPRLESKSVYVLTIETPGPSWNASKLRPLNITVEPKTAYILLDNLQFVPNDGQLRVPLPIGSHEYIINAPGYIEKKGWVTVEDEEGDVQICISLDPDLDNNASTEDGFKATCDRVQTLIDEWKLADAQVLINYMDGQIADKSNSTFFGIQKLKYAMIKKVDEGKDRLIVNIKKNKGKLDAEGKNLLQELLAVSPDDYWLNIIKNKQ